MESIQISIILVHPQKGCWTLRLNIFRSIGIMGNLVFPIPLNFPEQNYATA